MSVNAIAVRLSDGTVEAWPGALDDLRDGVLRVLHERSFVDDPTRVWRVARYAARLGFSVEPETARLAAAAGPGDVSGERLAIRACGWRSPSPTPAPCSQRLLALNPRVLPDGFAARPAALGQALDLLPADGRGDLTVLAACSAGMDAGMLARWRPARTSAGLARCSCAGWPQRSAGGPLPPVKASIWIRHAVSIRYIHTKASPTVLPTVIRP